MKKKRILFLCTGNSCRSQMAEGWTKHLKGDAIEAYSAGTEPEDIKPDTKTVMAEAGVDISGQRSKDVRELPDIPFDLVITLCDSARESCPVFPKKTKMLHAGFEDPARLAGEARSEEEALSHYRRIRDEIEAFIRKL
jgi:arsenate reductase